MNPTQKKFSPPLGTFYSQLKCGVIDKVITDKKSIFSKKGEVSTYLPENITILSLDDIEKSDIIPTDLAFDSCLDSHRL